VSGPRVSLLTLGCARNEVDSSEIAGRLAAGGYTLLDERDQQAPDVIVVNTCAFVEAAKKDSIDAVLAAADTGAKVVAVGCMAQRYGAELAEALPEADAVLGFDAYPDLPRLLGDVLQGHRPAAHTPVDRRTLLPIAPVDRPAAAALVVVPGHGATRPPASVDSGEPTGIAGGPVLRRLLRSGPVAPLKIASGCDRRCTFCAIPSFRGSFVSRPANEILAEAKWLADQQVTEVVLVSENSTSYGKDLPGADHLETLLTGLARTPGLARVRLTYLQPAETRPSLIAAIATTAGVADYFDMSFQHASATVLRRMRRFGSRESFLALVDQIRAAAPDAGIRTNVIVGFPGETEDDLGEL
jgi:ribosomal protein S12 methylthiotransferase